jgi:hypothetical protein
MIKYFKNAFKITNENIILTTPLILFLFLLSIYLEVARNAPANILSMVLLLVTTLFMLAAFSAGWFNMVKKAVALDKQEFLADEDRAKASFNLIKELPAGVGEYFLSFIGGIILYFILFMVLSLISYKIGVHFLGQIDLSQNELLAILNSADVKNAISVIPAQKLAKLEIWYMIFLTVMTIHYFITMFLVPEIVNRTKNPVIALGKSIAFVFKNFLGAVVLFLYVNIVSFLASLAIQGIMYLHFIPNFITALVSMLIYFYFIVYVIVLVFLYYDSTTARKIENNCNSGIDSVGQNQICGQDSLEE